MMYYTATIYKNNNTENLISGLSYNIVITITENKYEPKSNSVYGEYVGSYYIHSKKRVKLSSLCLYFDWKFLGKHSAPNIRTNGVYIGIWHDVAWIKSILEVELDYHVGKKKCTRNANAAAFQEYKASRFSGFQTADMSASRLNIWTNSLPAPPDPPSGRNRGSSNSKK